MTTPAPLASLASLVPDGDVRAARIVRSRRLRYEHLALDEQPELQRALTKLVVRYGVREQTWYQVQYWANGFWDKDAEKPKAVETYRELADATAAYQRLF